jgi:hypothetical protein
MSSSSSLGLVWFDELSRPAEPTWQPAFFPVPSPQRSKWRRLVFRRQPSSGQEAAARRLGYLLRTSKTKTLA